MIAIVGALSSDDITSLNRWRTSQAIGSRWYSTRPAGVGEMTEKAARLASAADATENELRRNGWRVARSGAVTTYFTVVRARTTERKDRMSSAIPGLRRLRGRDGSRRVAP